MNMQKSSEKHWFWFRSRCCKIFYLWR